MRFSDVIVGTEARIISIFKQELAKLIPSHISGEQDDPCIVIQMCLELLPALKGLFEFTTDSGARGVVEVITTQQGQMK